MNYARDRQRLVDLLLAHRAATDVRLYPTIWRVLLLLTSRVWTPEKDTHLWENAAGELAGFAMLWRRQPNSPYLVLDWFIHPGQASGKMVKAILDWGSQRAQRIATETKSPLTLYTYVAARNETAMQSFLDQVNTSGFIYPHPNPEEHNVYFAKSLEGKILAQELPTGYTLRRLQGIADIAAYQNIYGFAKVSQEHLIELLRSDDYSFLVVIKPDGEFAAYCECSIWQAEWELVNQRIGWIDYIETKESEQGKGLGTAALLAGLAQLQSWGAETAMLVTVNTNIAAVKLYEKTGFERLEVVEPEKYEKQMKP